LRSEPLSAIRGPDPPCARSCCCCAGDSVVEDDDASMPGGRKPPGDIAAGCIMSARRSARPGRCGTGPPHVDVGPVEGLGLDVATMDADVLSASCCIASGMSSERRDPKRKC
jgi:hypothetical protein